MYLSIAFIIFSLVIEVVLKVIPEAKMSIKASLVPSFSNLGNSGWIMLFSGTASNYE